MPKGRKGGAGGGNLFKKLGHKYTIKHKNRDPPNFFTTLSIPLKSICLEFLAKAL
jgi:hypothetical protein